MAHPDETMETLAEPAAEYLEAYENDRKYVLHSWSVQGTLKPPVITRGEGIYFWDQYNKKYMDFASQLVNLNIGFNHPKVVQAIKDQADKLCYVSPSFANDARGKLAKKIVEITPSRISKCFFTVGGADANENAVKMARAFTGRHKIISRYRSYHGATYGAISLTGDPRRPPVEPALPGILRAFDPYCYRCTFGQTYPDCKLECAEHIREMILYENPGTVAAVIVEPVTGSNGIFIPPLEYIKRLREICDEFGILLIADEVMTGFGRTGEWFGINLFDVEPDIMTMAKGCNSGYIPLGIVAVSKEIADFFNDKMLYCGLTYSGHPLACAAAVANIEAYEEEKLIENSRNMGQVMARELAIIKEMHPCVGDVRNVGLFGCIELVKDRTTREPLVPWNGAPGIMNELKDELWAKGLYLYMRWNYIFLAPPVIVNEEQLCAGLEIIDEALKIADPLAVK